MSEEDVDNKIISVVMGTSAVWFMICLISSMVYYSKGADSTRNNVEPITYVHVNRSIPVSTACEKNGGKIGVDNDGGDPTVTTQWTMTWPVCRIKDKVYYWNETSAEFVIINESSEVLK